MNTIADTRRKLLREYMERYDISQTELGRRLGYSRGYISLLIRSERPFGEKAARDLEEKLGLQRGYFDGLTEKNAPIETWGKPEDLDEGVYALVPRLNLKVITGDGIVVVDETELPPLAFRRDWLISKNVTAKQNLRILTVKGDSMSPYLASGDIVMIDMGQKEIEDGLVYAIRYGDELRIKRLYKAFDGGLKIASDNPTYPDEKISREDMEHIAVIGKLIWRAG